MADWSHLDKTCSAVARLLKEERERRGLTGAQLAETCGLNQSTISLMDRGLRKPTLDTLLRICTVLEVELGEILLKATREPTGSPTRTRTRPSRKAN